jgi:uncharacterized protein YecT (DUF1311 family)
MSGKTDMKLAVLLFLTSTGLHAQQIEYFVEKSDDAMFSALRAKVNGKTYTLIDKSKEMCLAVMDQRDWDGNGLKDALVERSPACGGNCCPNTYFFVSAFPGGRFELSQDLADSWAEPTIDKWKNAWSVVIVSNNEGENIERPVEITRRFVLRSGKGVKVSESLRKEMESVLEMRSEIFHGPDEQHSIQYDLDGDGRKDTISGKLWERWGRILWSVQFANGKAFETDTACKRIGVLKTVSGGVHDLVCDQDTVFRWTGDAYTTSEVGSGDAASVKPSFDCGKAGTPVELLICRDGRLAGLEVEMVAAYKQALSRLSADGQAALKRDHAAWFRNYSRTCNAGADDQDRAACVGRFLTEHAAELRNRH